MQFFQPFDRFISLLSEFVTLEKTCFHIKKDYFLTIDSK